MNCFCLYPKNNPAEPAILQVVDEEICKHFGVEVDPVKYVCGWYDSIGFRVACGKTFEQIREEFKKYQLEKPEEKFYSSIIQVLDFLDERYTTDAWAEVGR